MCVIKLPIIVFFIYRLYIMDNTALYIIIIMIIISMILNKEKEEYGGAHYKTQRWEGGHIGP